MKKLLSGISVALFGLLAAASFSAQAQAQDKVGDAAAGEKKVAMCVGCHSIPGYQASFPQVYKVPMLSGQNAKYIATALAEYKKGQRRHQTMQAIAASLSEQDMADVGAFFAANAGNLQVPAELAVQPSPAVAELLTKGNCASCHGANFSKPIDGAYPKLAGQHPDYLFAALKAYQTEHNPAVGRSNPIMAAQAKPFSHAELKELAAYLASLPSELRTVPEARFR